MIRIYFIIALLISVSGFAQKKELRKAQKLFSQGKIDESLKMLEESDALFDTADDKTLASYSLLLAKIARSNSEFQKTFDFLSAIRNSPSVKSDVAVELDSLTNNLIASGVKDSDEKKYLSAEKKFFLVYSISPELNINFLYFAASSAVNAKDYDAALNHYLTLEELKYTGIITKYFVTEVESGNEIEVQKSEYDLFKKLKQYKDFREEQTDSRFPEIVKNIALIYVQKNDNEKAFDAIKQARQENPNDVDLILTEASIYNELNEKEKVIQLIEEAIEMKPNDSNLYFNLGLTSEDLDDLESAKKYYEKAIELDSNNLDANWSLIFLFFDLADKVTKQMDNVPNTRAGDAEYDLLIEERKELYRKCLPMLNTLVDVDKKDRQKAIKQAMQIYSYLEMVEDYRKMKALLDE